MRHNESGVLRTVAGNALTAAPPPADAPGDYGDRYEVVQHLRDTPDRPAGPYDLSAGGFVIARTGQYYSVARTKEAHSDGSADVEWRFNTEDGTGNASLKYWKAYADSKAETGEAYLMKGDPAKRLWALVPRNNMVCTFSWKTMESEQRAAMLPPPPVRGYFAENAGAKSKASSKKGGKK
jgi:hypothetical protein